MSTYVMIWGSERYTLHADWGQAGAPIYWCDEITPYQVADVRHDWSTAARRLLRQEARYSGLDPESPEISEEIEEVIESAIWEEEEIEP